MNARLPRIALLLLWLAVPASAAAEAGRVALLTGEAQATDPATLSLRTLRKEDVVHAGEIVSTGPDSYLNLRFTDDSFVLLRPNSRFAIEDYRTPEAVGHTGAAATPSATADPQAAAPPPLTTEAAPARGRAFFRLLKGGFRAVTGLIGRADPQEYRVSTPVATIGIRGTDYWTLLCNAVCAVDPAFAEVLTPGASAEGGVIVGVVSGQVIVVSVNGNTVELGAGQYLLNLPDGTQVLLQRIPAFLQLNPFPDPTELCDD